MSQTFVLSDDELILLTRKRRPFAQMRALRSMGIDHRQRPDGSVAVLRSTVETVLGAGKPTPPVKEFEINYDD
jgi:Domain of unknown function (DUF4224)